MTPTPPEKPTTKESTIEGPKADKSETTDIADPYVDKVVDEIKHDDADRLLKAKDEEIERAFEPAKTRWQRFRAWFGDIWAEPKWRYSIIGGVLAVLVAVGGIPASRYFVLNSVGVRASALVLVQDDKTTQPVKNALVELAGQSVKTDKDGQAMFKHLKLGATSLHIKKAAYAEVRQTVTLGWGSNSLGSKTLTAVGARLQFKALDWLSKQPLAKAEAVLGDSSALANDDGMIELPIEAGRDTDLKVSIQADHYTSKTVDASLNDQATKEVPLVLSYPEFFVSNRTGKFDLYRSNVDGGDEKVILAGTGREDANSLELSLPPSRKYVAFVSKRDAEYNKDGYQLKTLTIIDTSTDTAKKITTSEDIYGVGWDDTHLVYVKVAAGASAANPNRNRLMSYNLTTGKEQELAASNYFVSTLMLKGAVYYTPSDIYTGGKRGIYRIQPDGGNKQTIYDQDTWSVYRTDWDQLTFQTPDKWFRYSPAKTAPEKLAQAPGNPHSVNFNDSDDRSQALWFEERDGKGTLLLRDTVAKTDKVIKAQSGLSSIVGWVGDHHVIYRVATPAETADYIISLDGGEAVKIKNVYNVPGQSARY